MKTVLFVPGYQENIDSRDYSSTMRAIEKQGYKVKFIPITWKRTTIEDWVKELEDIYAQHNPKEAILAGFSFGAMTAFTAASRRTPSGLWLFSLSPYFAEDLESSHMKPTWLKHIGQRRVTAFSKLNFKSLSRQIECSTLLFVGQLEIDKWPVMGERLIAAHKYLKNNELIVIENTEHDVTNKAYVNKIVHFI